MKVIIIDKRTKETVDIYCDNLTEEQAYSICEAWGWNYDDGHRSFWLDVEE